MKILHPQVYAFYISDNSYCYSYTRDYHGRLVIQGCFTFDLVSLAYKGLFQYYMCTVFPVEIIRCSLVPRLLPALHAFHAMLHTQKNTCNIEKLGEACTGTRLIRCMQCSSQIISMHLRAGGPAQMQSVHGVCVLYISKPWFWRFLWDLEDWRTVYIESRAKRGFY